MKTARHVKEPSAIRIEGKLQLSHIPAHRAGAAQIGVLVEQRLLQHVVGMPADNHVDALHLLGQPLVGPQAQMGQHHNRMGPGFPETAHLFLKGLHRLIHLPAQQPVEDRILGGGPRNPDTQAILLPHQPRLHPFRRQARLQVAQIGNRQGEGSPASEQLLEPGFGEGQAFIIAQRGHIIASGFQHLQVG
ncbi:hypothetical protein D3C75_879950 [compost metagenome]